LPPFSYIAEIINSLKSLIVCLCPFVL